MSFAKVIGQDRAKQIIQRALMSDRLPHALLLYGPVGVGKKAMALEVAKSLNCTVSKHDACDRCQSCRRVATMQHPDLHVVFPIPPKRKSQNKEDASLDEEDARVLLEMARDPYAPMSFSRNANISIDRIRALKREASYRVYEGTRKVAVVLEADRMRPAAANALLKTLEEPPGHLVLVLTTAKPEALLPTILSRCQRVRMSALSAQEIAQQLQERHGVAAQQAQAVARLADGSLSKALAALDQDIEEHRARAYGFLTRALSEDGAPVFEMVEAITARRDRALVEQLLETLLVWLRDLLLWEHDSADCVVNFDRTNQLAALAGSLDWAQLGQCVEEVDACFEMLARNVNPQLILLGLAFRLRQIVRARAA